MFSFTRLWAVSFRRPQQFQVDPLQEHRQVIPRVLSESCVVSASAESTQASLGQSPCLQPGLPSQSSQCPAWLSPLLLLLLGSILLGGYFCSFGTTSWKRWRLFRAVLFLSGAQFLLHFSCYLICEIISEILLL